MVTEIQQMMPVNPLNQSYTANFTQNITNLGNQYMQIIQMPPQMAGPNSGLAVQELAQNYMSPVNIDLSNAARSRIGA